MYRECYEELVRTGVTTKPFESVFEDLDADGSQTITYNEFIAVRFTYFPFSPSLS